MADRYCRIGGQQYGPVSEEELRRWIAEGRVRSLDLVWQPGTGDRVIAGSVPGLMGGPTVAYEPTGGRTTNAELMRQARECLRGRWGIAIGLVLLYLAVIVAMGMVPFVSPIVHLILGGAFELGVVIFFLGIARRGPVDIVMLFKGFERFGVALGAYLLRALFIGLWSLLLIVPGIIAALAYSQTFYVIADDPSVGPLGAMRVSAAMMQGYKWKLFCLVPRFVGWTLLCVVTLFIGLIWVMPWMMAAYARFYDDLREPRRIPLTAPAGAPPTPAAGPADREAPPASEVDEKKDEFML